MSVKNHLLNKIKEKKSIHMTLLDPDKIGIKEFLKLGKHAQESGSSAIMVGGSLGVSTDVLNQYLRELKHEISIPVILFPGSIAGLSNYADAVWFLSVLNSSDPYFIIGAQVQAAVLLIKRFKTVEPISLAYIVVGDGGSVSYVSHTRPIPYNKEDVILAYALAAQCIGFDFIYLEAGSGAKEPVSVSVISKVKKFINRPLIVGGGIRDSEIAYRIAKAGADIVVTGTIVEKKPEILKEIVKAIEKGGNERITTQ